MINQQHGSVSSPIAHAVLVEKDLSLTNIPTLRAAEIRLNKDLFTENATVSLLGKYGTLLTIEPIDVYLSKVSLLTRQMAFEVKDIVKNSDGKIIEFSIIEY